MSQVASSQETKQTPAAPPAKSKAAPTAATAKTPDELYVVDPTCKPGGPVRIHQMPNPNGGPHVEYHFKYGEPVAVPFHHGMKFLEAGFYVARDGAMKEQMTVSRSAKDGHAGRAIIDLKPDEVVASLGELTQEALLKRAVTLPGGHAFNYQSKRDRLIKHIVGYHAEIDAHRGRVEKDDMIEGEGEVSLDELEADKERFLVGA